MTTAPDRATPKILLVDDTPQNIALLEDTLSAFEADLLAATSGERALELAGRPAPGPDPARRDDAAGHRRFSRPAAGSRPIRPPRTLFRSSS